MIIGLSHDHNIETLPPHLVAARGFNNADDVAAVLHHLGYFIAPEISTSITKCSGIPR